MTSTNAPAVLAAGTAQSQAAWGQASLWIHVACVYPAGQEKALGGQDLARVAVSGQELATVAVSGREQATIAAATLDIQLSG